ncbi:MAG TPA: inositol monophosphatase family protein [Candidatus Elarobacter sp.]|nr:inositol monophosphatase family protein [Candidatus Elarobacter sp.]
MLATDVVVRPARWGDRAAILALTLAMGGHDDVAHHDDPMRRLGAALGRADMRTLVAQRDARVVGYAELQARVSSLSDRVEAWLGALVVAPDARRSGVGEALVAAVEREARMLGCDAIVLESSAWRDGAHAFYRGIGFVERAPAKRFVRPVGPAGAPSTLEERFLAAAARAASAVEAAIAGLRDLAPVGRGADGAPTEAADAAAETAALAELATLGCAIVSEECGLVGGRPNAGEPWIALDPLDGSRNYRAGYSPYAFAAGLVRDGVAIAGYVADLTSGRRWWAANGEAHVDGRRARTRRAPIAVVPSPAHGSAPAAVAGVARVRVSGSTAIDLCRVADGSAAAFVALDRAVAHAHDVAGAMAVVEAAGGCVLSADGVPPLLTLDPTRTHCIVAAADVELAKQILRET